MSRRKRSRELGDAHFLLYVLFEYSILKNLSKFIQNVHRFWKLLASDDDDDYQVNDDSNHNYERKRAKSSNDSHRKKSKKERRKQEEIERMKNRSTKGLNAYGSGSSAYVSFHFLLGIKSS